jgi:hypothetical protein
MKFILKYIQTNDYYLFYYNLKVRTVENEPLFIIDSHDIMVEECKSDLTEFGSAQHKKVLAL